MAELSKTPYRRSKHDGARSKKDRSKGCPVILTSRRSFAQLDALGARDFLPQRIPDDPPAEPDPRVVFDE
jgi:hypothetical protein